MKKIVFITATRADFGKLKSLIKITQTSKEFHVHIFATGMHLNSKYGRTVDEIYKSGFINIHQFINHNNVTTMDKALAKTIEGLSDYILDIKPDLIVVHGDRTEALAGAIVGSLNNIFVAHIEGGEISGTVDELIRHAVSKLSHIHLVANETAKKRLLQLGESNKSIFIIGSPDLDAMHSDMLPTLNSVRDYYNIHYKKYSIAIFHPVTTEFEHMDQYIKNFVDALIESDLNYIVIYPNNDLGSEIIFNEYKRIANHSRFQVFPSLRFEYFLTLLQQASFIIGNSSAGIREAHIFDIPSIDIGTRQSNRASIPSIFHCNYNKENILSKIKELENYQLPEENNKTFFGKGNSDKLFMQLLRQETIWQLNHQKQFQELKHGG